MKITAIRYTFLGQNKIALKKGDALIITMGAGDIYKVAEQIIE